MTRQFYRVNDRLTLGFLRTGNLTACMPAFGNNTWRRKENVSLSRKEVGIWSRRRGTPHGHSASKSSHRESADELMGELG